MADLISGDALDEAIGELDGWTLSSDGIAIRKNICIQGLQRCVRIYDPRGYGSRTANHHPEWSNVYNRVTIRWTTHSLGGISDLDVKLARSCDRFAAS